MRFATKAIRVAQSPEKEHRSVTYPLYQTSTFAWDQLEAEPHTAYSRVVNPNREVLEQVIASMENGEFCTCFASGMAAVTAVFSLLQSGDHIVCANDIYGGTCRMVDTILPRQGITHTFYDSSNAEALQAAIQPNTKMVIFEGPTNPLLKVCDIRATADIAREHGVISVFDNTFASPALQNPLDLGADVVIHSTTKYIGGHSDAVGGAVVTNVEKIAFEMTEWIKNTGATPSPFDNWLTLRGLKTLEVRMAKHCSNAQKIAEWLSAHPDVSRVYYPGLPDSPDHALAKLQMSGFGGMLSFEIGDTEFAKAVALACKYFLVAESLGGIESLIGYPTLMSHGCLTEEQRQACGIYPNLLRVSVGIEDPDDLIEDLDQAIEAAKKQLGSPKAAVNA